MRTRSGEDGLMGRRRWQAWVGVIAAALGAAFGGAAHAEEPKATAPAAVSVETQEAVRHLLEMKKLQVQGKYQEAIPSAQRLLTFLEKKAGPHHPIVATVLNTLGELYSKSGDNVRAEPLFKRSLAIREKALGADHPEVAASLNNLAMVHTAKGDYASAEPLFKRSLAICEKALSPDHTCVALLSNLATIYERMADYASAEPLFKRALAIYEKALGPDHPNVATSLNNLAMLYRSSADYARAEPLFKRALAIYEKALGPNHPIVATALNNLATLYQYMGDAAGTEPLLQRALSIQEKALGPDHPDVAVSLNNLAMVHTAKGDYASAEPLFKRSLAICERALGPDHPDVATSLNNLAMLYQSSADYARAEPLFKRALAIYEKALGPDHPNVATSLNNLAMLYQDMGDAAGTEPLLRRALSIREKALGPDHPDVAASLNNLAFVYWAKKDYARIEPLFRRALGIREKALGPDHSDVSQSLHNLGWLYVMQGRLPEAINAARQAADVMDRIATTLLATGSEEQKGLFMTTLVGYTFGDVALHIQHAPAEPDAARLALTTLLRRKGRVLDVMTDSLAALRRSLAPGDRELLARLKSVYSQLAAQLSRGPGDVSPERYRKDLAALEQARQTLEADVTQRSALLRGSLRLVTLAEVQAKIPEGAALVEIALYVPSMLRGGALAGYGYGDPRYVAYVLGRSGEPTFADLGEAAPLNAAVDTLRRALVDHDRAHDPKPAARAVDRLLMQPIRKLLGDTRWVFVSSAGPLQLVPFGALVDEQGHYLVERYLFSYLTTGRDLLRFGDTRPAPREAPLILANPDFNGSSARQGPEGVRRGHRSIDMVTQALPSLASTVEEANTIARLFPDSRVLLGEKATEASVKAARAPRILHLATHGFFLPEQPVPAALLRGPNDKPTPQEHFALLQRENPLLRSGVALAGFNRRESGPDDGVLTALEAASLDLYGTRLVVLSTCESGVGLASVGEGVYGLRRALTIAGAETQVMSLWQVDTGRTRELMQAYYERLKEGAGRSEAMRDVQLAMLSDPKTAHPNLWASFTVSGDWRTMEGEARLPEVGKVSPGARGCACEQAGGAPREHGAWLAAALAFLAAATRRGSSSRASTEA